MRLRAWQKEAHDRYEQQSHPKNFTVTATPGAGKTTFALAHAKRLLSDGVITQVVVVAPTDHLRTQWTLAAAEAGVNLNPKFQKGPQKNSDYIGWVTTYAQIAVSPKAQAFRVAMRRTLVILDEVHHTADGLSWGAALLTAAEHATKRLLLTGTPWRTSNTERIPYLTYEQTSPGEYASTADYTYGYRRALRGRVVRPVMFAAYSGSARWETPDGEVRAHTLGDELTATAETDTWRQLLDPAGGWISEVITAAHGHLLSLRDGTIPDAAGMVLASNQDDARAYAQIVHQVTGARPVLALSDDPGSSKKINAFRHSDAMWLIAVRQVSEGVDVARLACGIYATSYRTPLFFTQAIGRFVRARKPGEVATVFLPAVRSLLALAADLEAERDHALRDLDDNDASNDDDGPEPEDKADPGVSSSTLLDADAEFGHILAGGVAVTGDGGSEADTEFLGLLDGILTPTQTAALLRASNTERRQAKRHATLPLSSAPASQDRPVHEQAADLRAAINRAVNTLAAKTGQKHGAIHARLKATVSGPPTATAPMDVLGQRRDVITGWLR